MTITAMLKVATAALALQQPLELTKTDPVDCMIKNIWFEARGSSFTDKLAIAHVVMNRVADPDYPGTVCEVVWQYAQFSWTNDGKSDKVEVRNATDIRAWEDTLLAAHLAMEDGIPDLTGGATHYHANYVEPSWAGAMNVQAEFGAHIFYSDIEPAAGTPGGD